MWHEILPPAPKPRADQLVALTVRHMRLSLRLGAALVDELRLEPGADVKLMRGDGEHAGRMRLELGCGQHKLTRRSKSPTLYVQCDAWADLAGAIDGTVLVQPHIIGSQPNSAVIELTWPRREAGAVTPSRSPRPARPGEQSVTEDVLQQLRALAIDGFVSRTSLQQIAADRGYAEFNSLRFRLIELRDQGLIEIEGGGKGNAISGVRLVSLGSALPHGSRAVRGPAATGAGIQRGDKLKCMSCDATFASDGPHNRLCGDCRRRSEVDA